MKLYLGLFVLSALLFSFASAKVSCPARHPMVIVPGIGGSVLETKYDVDDHFWLPHWYCSRNSKGSYVQTWVSLLPKEIECYFAYMTMEYDSDSSTFVDPKGIDVRVPDWGGVSAMDTLDNIFPASEETRYMHTLINHLEKDLGYTVGKDLFGAPYDWRRIPDAALLSRLIDLVEQAYISAGNVTVDVVSHSMGGLVFYGALKTVDQAWKDKYIHHWACVSSPWIGATVDVRSISSGNNMGIIVTSDSSTLRLSQSLPAIHFLMPREKYWNGSGNIVVKTKSHSYTMERADLIELFEAAGVPTEISTSQLDQVAEYFGDYEYPGVDMYVMYSYGVKSEKSYEYSQDGPFTKEPEIHYDEEGDGTVDLQSLLFASNKWKSEGHSIFVKGVKGVEHMDSIVDSTVMSVIDSLVCNN